MDGLFFYWILWMAWVIVMFFIPQTVHGRYNLLFHLLAVMSLAAYELEVYRYATNLSSIYLLLVCCFYIRNLTVWRALEYIVKSFIISLGYASFQLFALLDPVWLLIQADWLYGVLLNYLALLLFRDWKLRFGALIVGMILGETIYSGLLFVNSIPYKAGSYSWLDSAVLVLLINLTWVALEITSRLIQAAIANRGIPKGASRIR